MQLIAGSADSVLREKVVGVRVGFQHFLLNDEIGSNLNYSGTGFSFQGGFDIRNSGSIHSMLLAYSSPQLHNDFNESVIDGRLGVLDYSYSRQVNRKAVTSSRLYFGPYLRLKVFQRPGVVANVNTQTGDYFASVGVRGFLLTQLGSVRRLTIAAGSSLVSYLVNREYVGSFTNDILYAHKLIDYEFELSYIRQLNRSVCVRYSYAFNFYYVDRSNDVKYGSHMALIGLQFNLGKK